MFFKCNTDYSINPTHLIDLSDLKIKKSIQLNFRVNLIHNFGVIDTSKVRIEVSP